MGVEDQSQSGEDPSWRLGSWALEDRIEDGTVGPDVPDLPVGGLVAEVLADFGVRILESAPRFNSGDWTYQGEPPLKCEKCDEQLHVYRRPFKAYGKDLRSWGIVCPECPSAVGIKDLQSKQATALHRWEKCATTADNLSPDNSKQVDEPNAYVAVSSPPALADAGTGPRLDRLVTVQFRLPVLGIDSLDESPFTADRHRVAAARVIQDSEDTVFVDREGVVVAEWPTSVVQSITWPPCEVPSPQSAQSSTEFADRMARIRQKSPSAYTPWTDEETERVRIAALAGKSIANIAKAHQRQPGAIRSRLLKLEKDQDPQDL